MGSNLVLFHLFFYFFLVFFFIILFVKGAQSVTFDLLILEIMFLIFKNTVKKTKIQVYI